MRGTGLPVVWPVGEVETWFLAGPYTLPPFHHVSSEKWLQTKEHALLKTHTQATITRERISLVIPISRNDCRLIWKVKGFQARIESTVPDNIFMKLTSVTSLALGFISQGDTSTRVNDSRLLDDQTISLQTSNVATRVGKSNFVDFVRVQPNFALSAFQHRRGEPLLQTKIDCAMRKTEVRDNDPGMIVMKMATTHEQRNTSDGCIIRLEQDKIVFQSLSHFH
jgi:hypothetical protein